MARKSNDWIVLVFLALLALFGVVCLSNRPGPPEPAEPADRYSAAGAPGSAGEGAPPAADNLELVVEDEPLHLAPENDPQFGVGPGLWGRDRVKMND